MPKLKVTLGIGYAGVRHEDIIEIDENAWDACETEEEREEVIDQHVSDWVNNYIDIGARIIDED
jgi:hypothetical protein